MSSDIKLQRAEASTVIFSKDTDDNMIRKQILQQYQLRKTTHIGGGGGSGSSQTLATHAQTYSNGVSLSEFNERRNEEFCKLREVFS